MKAAAQAGNPRILTRLIEPVNRAAVSRKASSTEVQVITEFLLTAGVTESLVTND